MAKKDAKEAPAAEEKALAVKPPESTALSTELAAEYDFGDASMFNFRDLIIPKLLVMQGLSKLVASGDAKMGDIVDTAANTIVGSVREKDKKPVRFYPMQMFRYWVHREKTDDGMKFLGATPWTAKNADMEWETKNEAGATIKNEETVVFAVVPESQLDDLDQPPRLLTFRSTGLKQTKAIKHHFFMCLSTKKEVPFQTMFELSGHLEQNDRKESWYLPDVLPKGKADDATAMKVAAFYKRYGTAIKEKVAGLLDDAEELTTESQGTTQGPRDVGPAPEQKVEAEGERAKF